MDSTREGPGAARLPEVQKPVLESASPDERESLTRGKPEFVRQVIAFLWVVVLAQSQPPVPTPTKPSQANQPKGTPKKDEPKTDKNIAHPPMPTVDQRGAVVTIGDQQQPSKQSDKAAPSQYRLTDWLVAIFTGVLAFLAWLQWRAMKKQAFYMLRGLHISSGQSRIASENALAARESAETAEKALLLTQRADVLLFEVNLSTTELLYPNTVITLSLKNFGPTRADSVSSKGWLAANDANSPPDQGTLPAVIGAGDVLRYPFKPMIKCFSQTTIDRIQSGETTLWFHLEIEYRDVFGKTHHTKTAGIFNPKTFTFIVKQNEAD